MQKKALITGIAGQDGSYLSELLLKKNYQIFGVIRNQDTQNYKNLEHIQDQIQLISVDLRQAEQVYAIINEIKPDEIYNLASQSQPAQSWQNSMETMQINGLAAHILFDGVRKIKPDCKVYQASSSDMYGNVLSTPQNEITQFNPVNPYAAAKIYAHHVAKIYRTSFKLFISCGILFNHESERRGIHFISQKVTYAAACLKLGIKNSLLLNEQGSPIVQNGKLRLGNLDAERDWGYAADYVDAMYLMLQQATPDDFVIGTGEVRTIRDLCAIAFSYLNLDWQDYIEIDPALVRPTETGPTVADASKAKRILGWEPKTSFNELIIRMVNKHLTTLTS